MTVPEPSIRTAFLFAGIPATAEEGCDAWTAAQAQFGPRDALVPHSLGLYAALFASGAVTRDGALALSREAGRAIRAVAETKPGGLLVVTGLARDAVEALAHDSRSAIAAANSPLQHLLGGDVASLERAEALARERGALGTQRMAIAAPLHTSGCAGAARELAAFVDSGAVAIRAPERRLFFTGSPEPGWLETADDVRSALARNLEAPVLWHAAVLGLRALGFRRFLDLGPGDALSRIVRFIDRELETTSWQQQSRSRAAQRS